MDWYQVSGVISLDGLNFSTACTYTVFEIIKTYQFMSFNTLINMNSYIENTIYNRNYRVSTFKMGCYDIFKSTTGSRSGGVSLVLLPQIY